MGVVEVSSDVNAAAVGSRHSKHKGNIRLIDTVMREREGRGGGGERERERERIT